MSQIGVSIVVVSFNTIDKTRKCLERLSDQREVIVIDNASKDGSPEMVENEFPNARLVRSETNLGFGRANNVGAKMATQPLVLYLNSDAYAEPGAIDHMADQFLDESIVAAGGRLLNMDGTLQTSTANRLTLWAVFCEQLYLEKIFRRSTLFNSYWTTMRLIDQPEPADTPQVMGAALMTRTGLEYFDEKYFMYCEDTDLCLRLSKHGRIVYVKGSEFYHELGASSAKDPTIAVASYNLGKEIYFRSNHGVLAQKLCAGMNWFGALIRAGFWCLKRGEVAASRRRGFMRIVRSKIFPTGRR